MLEKVLVSISLLALYVFCGVVLGFVAEPDLLVVTVLMLALATHDFWISVFKKKDGIKLDSGGTLESLPTGVSGKPAARKKAAPKKKHKK
jgi:hypothetical protein